MRGRLGRASLAALLLAGAVPLLRGADPPAPAEVRALEGTYTGSWTMFGLDEQGAAVKRAAWTDTMTATAPQVRGDRAFVKTADVMTFEGGRIPPRTVEGTEGYLLQKDGTLGDYFIETMGQTHRMVKVGDGVWSYAAPASAQELAFLGVPGPLSGKHVLVKVVTTEDKVETHRITRLTTVHWKGKDGQQRWTQYVSLQGVHKRRP